jgi:hypothetical protein
MTDAGKIQVRVMRLPHAADLPLPTYQSAHAAGLDLAAAVPEPVIVAPGGRAAIPTGLAFALPAGIEGQIRPRSGRGSSLQVTVWPPDEACCSKTRSRGCAFGHHPRNAAEAMMSTSPIFVATFADKVCTRMSINCPDDLDLERGKTLARYAYESRAGKPAPSFTKAHFEDTNGKVLMSYSAIELNDDADEPAPEPDEPAPSSKKRRSKSKDD